MRKILFFVVLALVLVTSVQLWVTQDRTSQTNQLGSMVSGTETATGGQVGGAFSLTDHTGRLLHDTDLHGHLLVVYFGFTQCPEACPTTLSMLTRAMKLLGDKADQVTLVFITVDPERDTPAVLKEYLVNFDKRIVGLTGTPQQIADLQKAYKVYSAKKSTGNVSASSPADKNYTVDHSSYMYLMDREGNFLNVLPYNSTEQDVVQFLTRYLK